MLWEHKAVSRSAELLRAARDDRGDAVGQAGKERAEGIALRHGVLRAEHNPQQARCMRVAERRARGKVLQPAQPLLTCACRLQARPSDFYPECMHIMAIEEAGMHAGVDSASCKTGLSS